ncbi:MAG: hypothetical protein MMC33_005814 [Icmadophila ericetorum]|nr:hypothetical protein [Icmadophila ericetorum]
MKYAFALVASAFVVPSVLAFPGQQKDSTSTTVTVSSTASKSLSSSTSFSSTTASATATATASHSPEAPIGAAAPVKVLPQDITATATSLWPKPTGHKYKHHEKVLKKYQPFCDKASKAIGDKSHNHFSAEGLCNQAQPCMTVTNATIAHIAPEKGKKIKHIGDKQISGLLDSVVKMKDVKLDKSIHEKLLNGSEQTFEGVVGRVIAPKLTMSAEELAGFYFDMWKIIATYKKPTAIRAAKAQTDGKPVELMSFCMYPEGSNKEMAENFCLGRDKVPSKEEKKIEEAKEKDKKKEDELKEKDKKKEDELKEKHRKEEDALKEKHRKEEEDMKAKDHKEEEDLNEKDKKNEGKMQAKEKADEKKDEKKGKAGDKPKREAFPEADLTQSGSSFSFNTNNGKIGSMQDPLTFDNLFGTTTNNAVIRKNGKTTVIHNGQVVSSRKKRDASPYAFPVPHPSHSHGSDGHHGNQAQHLFNAGQQIYQQSQQDSQLPQLPQQLQQLQQPGSNKFKRFASPHVPAFHFDASPHSPPTESHSSPHQSKLDKATGLFNSAQQGIDTANQGLSTFQNGQQFIQGLSPQQQQQPPPQQQPGNGPAKHKRYAVADNEPVVNLPPALQHLKSVLKRRQIIARDIARDLANFDRQTF